MTKAVLPGADDAPGILDIDAIAAVDDIGSEVVPMPEWGGSVPLKALTAAERVAAGQRVLRELKAKGNDYANGRLAFHIVAASMVDANGERLADPMAAAEILASKQYGPVNRLYEVAERLSGIGDAELEKRVEALGKAHPSVGSPTD